MGQLEVKHGHPARRATFHRPLTESHITFLWARSEAAPFPRLFQSSATKVAGLQVNNNDPIHLPKL